MYFISLCTDIRINTIKYKQISGWMKDFKIMKLQGLER